MILLELILLITINFINFIVCPFDNEDFFKLLCAADENNMEYMWASCEPGLRDGVDGCMEKCFIEMRNKRAPTTRIDEKYYQFVACDDKLWSEFAQCTSPCMQQLQAAVRYDAFGNLNEWSNCMVEMTKKLENEIEQQDDHSEPGSVSPESDGPGTVKPGTKKPGSEKPPPKGRPPKKKKKKKGPGGKNVKPTGSKTDKPKGKLKLRMKKN